MLWHRSRLLGLLFYPSYPSPLESQCDHDLEYLVCVGMGKDFGWVPVLRQLHSLQATVLEGRTIDEVHTAAKLATY